MTKRTTLVLFFATALVALAVHFFMFEVRYMWYVTHEQAAFMRTVYAACILAIVLLWTFVPSRIGVAVICVFALFFPHLFYGPEARPIGARASDLHGAALVATMAVSMIPVGLFVLATHLRLRSKKAVAAQ